MTLKLNSRKLAEFAVKITILLLLATLISCGRAYQELPANMEEIHRELGIPVRTQVIEYTEFRQEIEFTTTVHGLRETRVNSRLTDQVERVHVRVGQVVEANQVIISFPKDNPMANYFQVQAAYELAFQTFERMQSLLTTGGISQHEFDAAETSYTVAQANWETVRNNVYIRAPFRGTVTNINVRESQLVSAGGYLFTVSQLDRLHGRLWISEADITRVPRNAPVSFRWNEIERQGRITNIALSLNRDHNAFAADIEIINTDHAIRSGVTGRANIVLYHNPSAIVLPRNLVLRDLAGVNYVFTVEGEIAQRRDVILGNTHEMNVEIVDGLYPGDVIVSQGLQLVVDGARLNIQ
jgi:RND family efflux transporter MFP subunit